MQKLENNLRVVILYLTLEYELEEKHIENQSLNNTRPKIIDSKILLYVRKAIAY